MEAFFWISLGTLFYTYLGYGLLLFVFNALFKRRKVVGEDYFPDVSFIVPAYNEEAIIREKITNTLSLIYPAEKISFIYITDGSSDSTNEIIRGYPAIQLMHQPDRQGKSAALNRAMEKVITPIVVFSDANTLLHPQSILNLVRHYRDESVGGVSGEKRITNPTSSAVGFGEKLYWRYESALKKANADFYTIIGAPGELFSIRSRLYQPLAANIILDDFVISANVCLQGYRFFYEKDAYGMETSSASIAEERKRKVRISAGCFQALFLLKGLLNPFNNFRVACQYISHRVLRWTICPVLLPLLFVCNYFLFQKEESAGVYTCFFWGQCLFYFVAIGGWLLARQKITSGILLVPYYFLFMVFSQYAGFYRFVRRKQTVSWEKAHRETQKTFLKTNNS
jgi:cellulose synthase/poly-beta-1,6-N-acetylglucosamine synthase-like glycosyltransferase